MENLEDVIKDINKTEKWISKSYPLFFAQVLDSNNLHITWKEKLYLYVNKIDKPLCYCGNSLKFLTYNTGYRKFCSVKCLSNSNDVKDKIKSTNIYKYGCEVAMKSDIVKNNLKNSISIKYGVDNISKLQSIKDRVVTTNNEKYGVDYLSQLASVKESLSNIMKGNSIKLNSIKKEKLLLYLIDKVKDYDISLLSVNSSIYEFSHSDHNFNIHKNMLNDRIRLKNTICTICNPINEGSDSQKQLYEFISNLESDVIESNRTILNGQELDIYLPSRKLAFEYNGLYWHSDKFKDRLYHLNKTKKCELKGVQLIHIWEDDWLNKREIVKSKVRDLLGNSDIICSRRCEVRVVDNKTTSKFLDDNYIQGKCNSSINLGLYYNESLVCMMTFSVVQKSYELLKFCNILNTSVVGGDSKLFKYFIDHYKPISIIGYSLKCWSQGNLYKDLNFKYDSTSDPEYFWIINGIREHCYIPLDKLTKCCDKSANPKIYNSGSDKWIWLS